MTAGLLDWATSGLVHGTALAVVTGLAVATALRRARPAVVAALWTVVLLKFVVPVGPAMPLSLSTALDRALERASSAGGEAPVGAPVDGAAAIAETGGSSGWPSAALLVAYAVGLAILVGRRAVRHRALVRRVRAVPPAPPEAVAALARLAAGLGRRAPALPAMVASADAHGPFLVGLYRPVLVVPAWLDPSSPAWAAAMTHELAHLARRDPWLRALESAVRVLFFFWPPVAWVCRRIDRAREMACDQWAVAHGPLPARDYARLLLALATRDRSLPASAMALVRSRSQLGARVDRLLAGAAAPTIGGARGSLVALWAIVCLAGAARTTRAAAPIAGAECALAPALISQILASHPDADADGDGVLSQDEACAHQQRMRQRLLDRVVDADLASRLDPAADLDGDGALSDDEIATFKDQLEVELADGRGDEVVIHYDGEPVPLPAVELRVSAAAASARVCRAAPCADGGAPDLGAPARGRFPLLIDVSLSAQE